VNLQIRPFEEIEPAAHAATGSNEETSEAYAAPAPARSSWQRLKGLWQRD
jgi:hypothetical protein